MGLANVCPYVHDSVSKTWETYLTRVTVVHLLEVEGHLFEPEGHLFDRKGHLF